MTNIEQKALELVNEVNVERGYEAYSNLINRRYDYAFEALCRAIERHEAFRQEVSDAVEKWDSNWNYRNAPYRDELLRFIIAKPDPLVEVIKDADDIVRAPDAPSYPEAILAALAKRVLEIREKEA